MKLIELKTEFGLTAVNVDNICYLYDNSKKSSRTDGDTHILFNDRILVVFEKYEDVLDKITNQ